MSDRDEIAEDILDAALQAFGTRGFRATSLSHVASVAKVSRPTLYARHPDKPNLFRAVVRRVYEEGIAEAEQAVAEPSGLEEAIRGLLHGYYGTIFDRLHGLPQIEELALVQSELAEDLVAEARESFRKLVNRTLRSQARAGAADAEQLGVPLSQVADLLRLAPLSLKGPETGRSRYRRDLANLARVVAAALGEG